MKLFPTTTLLALFYASGVAAFFQTAARGGKTSALTEEAVQIFNKKYPFGREPPKANPLGDFGMPNRDIDGSVVKKTFTENKRLTDISEQEAKASFNELCKLYGEERALNMVKALPLCLAFDKRTFGASLKEWTDIFGEEESKDMVLRNPGLLAVRPDEAAKATDQTMTFSYIVAYTRPLGPVLLPLILFLLLTPGIEYVTGVPIRSSFLGAL